MELDRTIPLLCKEGTEETKCSCTRDISTSRLTTPCCVTRWRTGRWSPRVVCLKSREGLHLTQSMLKVVDEMAGQTDISYSNLNILIVPNPTRDFVTVSLSSESVLSAKTDAKIVIRDLSGKELYSSKLDINQAKRISLESFGTGMYIYEITNRDHLIESGKLMVQ